jgi:hypothetical protein
LNIIGVLLGLVALVLVLMVGGAYLIVRAMEGVDGKKTK